MKKPAQDFLAGGECDSCNTSDCTMFGGPVKKLGIKLQ
jgi:hypothetical protein